MAGDNDVDREPGQLRLVLKTDGSISIGGCRPDPPAGVRLQPKDGDDPRPKAETWRDRPPML